jgi:hypothetical protein
LQDKAAQALQKKTLFFKKIEKKYFIFIGLAGQGSPGATAVTTARKPNS